MGDGVRRMGIRPPYSGGLSADETGGKSSFLPAEEEGHDDNTEALRRWKIDVRQVRDKMTRMIPPDGEGVTADRETALMFFETALLYCASREVSEKIRRRFRYRVAWKELNRYPQNLMNWIMDREDRGENDMLPSGPDRNRDARPKRSRRSAYPWISGKKD